MEIVVGGRTFRVLFPDLIRPLTPAERERLKASMEETGLHVPIVIDEEDGIIDGRNRLEIAAELGWPIDALKFDVRRGLSDDAKRNLAASLNRDRRQLSREELAELRRERIERVVKLREQGKSTTAIGEELGVHHKTVLRDLRSAICAGAQIDEPERVKKRRGGTYPAKLAKRSAAAGGSKPKKEGGEKCGKSDNGPDPPVESGRWRKVECKGLRPSLAAENHLRGLSPEDWERECLEVLRFIKHNCGRELWERLLESVK